MLYHLGFGKAHVNNRATVKLAFSASGCAASIDNAVVNVYIITNSLCDD